MAERPTALWRNQRLEQEAAIEAGSLDREQAYALDLFPEVFLGPADVLLDVYNSEIAAAPHDASGYPAIMAAIEHLVEGLNSLNEEGDQSWIETGERESQCEYIDTVILEHGADIDALAQSQGLEYHELADEWRNW